MSAHRNYNPAITIDLSDRIQHGGGNVDAFGKLPALNSSELPMRHSGDLHGEIGVTNLSLAVPTPAPVAAEDQKLVQECLQGDEQAWGKLIDKYKRLVYSLPVKSGFRPKDASDIFQTVCIDLFTNLCNLRKVESLRSWLITVTSHKCFHWKKQQRPDVELDAMEQEIVEDLAAAPEMLQEI